MDFDFVSAETKELLISFINRANSYSDYVELVSEYVLSQMTDVEIVLLAIRHCENLGWNEIQYKIVNKYQRLPEIVPFFLQIHSEKREEWDIVIQEFNDAIKNSNNDWITYFYLIQLYWLASTRSIDVRVEERAATQLENLVKRNVLLNCYTPQYHYLKSQRVRYEGDIPGAIELCNVALSKAMKFEDIYFESRLLKELGALTGFYTVEPNSAENGLSFLFRAKEICKELGDPRGLIEVLSYIAGINAMNGVFTVWRDINLEMLKTRELIGDDPVYEFHNIAAAYHQMGNGKEALEWALLALDSAKSRPLLLPIVHLDVAWAMILLDRLSEAKEHIETARKLNLEAGLESGLAYEYMVTAQHEKAIGDYDSAIHSLENALEINQRNARFNRAVSCLMYLAEIEVARFQGDSQNNQNDASGPWMEEFESTIEERSLHGYAGVLLCLKSDLRFKQGRHSEAREYAIEVVSLSQQPDYEYLRDIIRNLRIEKYIN